MFCPALEQGIELGFLVSELNNPVAGLGAILMMEVLYFDCFQRCFIKNN